MWKRFVVDIRELREVVEFSTDNLKLVPRKPEIPRMDAPTMFIPKTGDSET